jgi:hypothetical protein
LSGSRPFIVGLISIQKTSVWSVFTIEIHVNNHLVIVTAVYVIPGNVREVKYMMVMTVTSFMTVEYFSNKSFPILVYNDIRCIKES